MKRVISFIIIEILIFFGCSNRVPPTAVEQARPDFVRILEPLVTHADSIFEDTRSFAIPIDTKIVMEFGEPMDPTSFPGNFFLLSLPDSEEIQGTFSADTKIDTLETDTIYTINFAPSKILDKATEYLIVIKGGVKDVNGNSASIDPTYDERYEFITGGDYSADDISRVLVSDPVTGLVYAIDTLHQKVFTNLVQQPTAFSFFSGGNVVYISDASGTHNGLYYFDPSSSALIDSVTVGKMQLSIDTEDDFLAVSTIIPRKVWLVDMGTNLIEQSFDMAGKIPIKVALSNMYLYVANSLNGNILVYERTTGIESVIESVFSKNPKYLSLTKANGRLWVTDYADGQVHIIEGVSLVQTVELEIGAKPVDASIYGDRLFISDENGLIYKYSTEDLSLVSKVNLGTKCLRIDLTQGGEILYGAMPDLAALGLILTKGLRFVRTVPLSSGIESVFVISK
jgi:hypothetical protein